MFRVAARPVTLSFLGGSPLLRRLSRELSDFGRLVGLTGGRRGLRFVRSVDIRSVWCVSFVDVE